MILLLSSDGDYSTDVIVQWLKNRKYTNYLRLHPMDFVDNKIVLKPADGKYIFHGEEFDFSSVSVVWNRRFGRFVASQHYDKVEKQFNSDIAELLRLELNNITELFVSLIPNDVQIIGSTNRNNTNKLVELRNAQYAGLKIPETIVTSEKEVVRDFLHKKGKVISKSAYNARSVLYQEDFYTMFTTEITDNDLSKLPDHFFPSMIQEEIVKDFEVRVFFILGKIYSMAIISQDNPQTMLDFRKYDMKKPNRFVPCEIDNEIKNRICSFMSLMSLNVGSLDFIKGKDGNLYFLEVNFMGQFGMVDFPCNYGIHRHICDVLIEIDKKKCYGK